MLAALLVGSVSSSTAAAAAPLPAVAACVPEAPICLDLRGTPGAYRLWFSIRPAVPPSALAFTVNGTRATGSLRTQSVGTRLEGEFRPAVPLVTGDRICLRTPQSTGPHCATTP